MDDGVDNSKSDSSRCISDTSGVGGGGDAEKPALQIFSGSSDLSSPPHDPFLPTSHGDWASPPTAYRPLRAPAAHPSMGPPGIHATLLPVPQPLPIPVFLPPYSFQVPKKRITSTSDIEKFHSSEAGRLFLGFVAALSQSIEGHKLSDYCRESVTVRTLVEILDRMNSWIDEIPPLQQPARYGNPAFRDWQARLEEQGPSLVLKLLPKDMEPGMIELFPYFADSFGNATRIDYGTGHEANFCAFLFCLARLGLVNSDDYQALVSRTFVRYLELMRKLQTTYWLEPAGSHGVWGLDDYHFLPFIFGSSQLINHKYMKPKSIHNEDILENFSNEYLYLGCVSFVKKVKKGHLAEHSPMIDDISGVPSWSKVNSGMLKMYKAEVLEKVPIMQHFLFGSLIRWE
ncbi:hypothetical protein KP509_12G087500 [Ceratopteris richardii]|uniref:Serine/threonine-protein phosphatase 2A activator n=1 Tax=Ceratopteris richardii TaxID=49495 RepID=A0A8T2TRK2_CERRI|nr:hypothetical protein KP509_12G087500 [Ceratopteris richardii]